jgi:hypothetical protein
MDAQNLLSVVSTGQQIRTFTDSTGVIWRILKDNRPGAPNALDGSASAGDGTILLLTENVYGNGVPGARGGSYIYTTPASDPWDEYANVSIKNIFNDWYAANTSAALKARARIPSLGYEATYSGTGNGFIPTWNVESALSTPGVAAGAATEGVIFPLSVTEVTRYVYDGVNDSSRIAYDLSSRPQYWWLRSPGGLTVGAAYTRADGTLGGNYIVGDMFDIRPALWIDTIP